ncbi:Tudor/PWWP/MBT superfamily protein, putative isoform 1 [Cucumis melo var. makuwa]|uniref:Tudor/PWWP/MBT superfamily protein, putative isoform 1 n=1 Tax=Cucumis melo var. makuwa TaxID=1194695 RepID=A0A5A7UZ27_CUCMM|nr:Tudor/PWWP/MBT superfamily protein, putative isoform 1 [Cucumis melo var. makuwa]
MGSSSEAKGIDSSVGGLVWVRRRNGSWWPGKILGLDELSESCLVSPRSGTPVKLLGREDASIDWYNLEKSKRVKAFRCGEYDECIEKAKASAANSCKKAVKYARREDAILHALELESALLGKDQLDFSYRTQNNVSDGDHGILASESSPLNSEHACPKKSNSIGNCPKKSNSEDTCPKKSNSEVSSDSAPEISHSDIPSEETNHASSSKVLSEHRRRTPNDSEDDGTEGVKRMRGLEDLGMGSLANGKSHAGVQLEKVQQEDASQCDANTGNCVTNGNGNPPKIIHMYSSSLRRKRSPVATVQEFLKRKNRRRPLTKVLESTAMVSVPVFCDQLPNTCSSNLWGSSDGKISELDTESKRTNSLAIINSSDGNGTAVSCDNEAFLSASEVSRINSKAKENEVSSISEIPENNTSDKLFDVTLAKEEKHPAGFSPTNPYSSSGRSTVGALGKQSSRSTPAASLENEATKEPGSSTSAATRNDNTKQKIERGTSRWQLKGKRKSRHLSNYRKQDSKNSLDVDDASDACLAGKVDYNNIGRSPSANDCNLLAKSKKFAESQVDGLCEWSKQVSYRKPNASDLKTEMKQLLDDPLVPQKLLPYRQSRFAVHRYQMSEFYVRNHGANSLLYDVELEVKASYRPQHVPLVSLMSKLNGKAIVGHPLTVEIVEDGHCDSLLSRADSEREGDEHCYVTGKHSANARTQAKQSKQSPSQPCFSPSKSPRMKKSGHLCKKIRKLSSLTGNRHQNQPKRMVQKSSDHVITCIPLKVVFSRINEAVSGLARPSHHALT